MPKVVFHVTSTRNRRSILQHGLDWRRMAAQPGIAGSPTAEGPCVFLADDMEMAEWFVSISRSHHTAVDIWEVTLPDNLDLKDIDAWAEAPPAGPYGEIDGFLCTTEPIPPDRLRLVTTKRSLIRGALPRRSRAAPVRPTRPDDLD
jgi:hypothetical protein